MSPQNAFQTLLGIETLSLRMERHVENAEKIAAWLEARPAGRIRHLRRAAVLALARARQAALPARRRRALHLRAQGRLRGLRALVDAVELFSHVANLGDTRSLIIHSASTTHRQLTPEQQTAAGAAAELVRLSIGIEDADDLIRDLDQALAKAVG